MRDQEIQHLLLQMTRLSQFEQVVIVTFDIGLHVLGARFNKIFLHS